MRPKNGPESFALPISSWIETLERAFDIVHRQSHNEVLFGTGGRHGRNVNLPAIFGFREFPAAGGLMSYGADLADNDRTIGGYVGRILKGERPGDLPVQQSIRVQLVLNAAKTLGITLPQTLQVAADEVIQ